MSTTLRLAWLKTLRTVGVRQFVATSSMGQRFVCHLGDFPGENPFYNRDVFRTELECCAAWLRHEEKPVVLDVGANLGFWSTHLAQMLAGRAPENYAFEPVPKTFLKLVQSVERLGLSRQIHVVAAAVLEKSRPVRLSYSEVNSLFAQVADNGLNIRAGDQLVHAAGITLDEFCAALEIKPCFLKVDVEGYEINVLLGARRLLEGKDRPALLFEFNPATLAETGTDSSAFSELLSGYTLYYLDDFEGQKLPLGEKVHSWCVETF